MPAMMPRHAYHLRRPLPEDGPASVALHCDPATNRFRPGGPPSPEEAEGYLPGWLAHWDQHGFGYSSLVRSQDGRVLGFGGLMHKQWGPHSGLNLYFRLAPEAWNQGLSTWMARQAIEEARARGARETVLGLVRPDNLPSRRALERLGLVLIDTLDDVPGEAPSLLYALALATGSGPL